jgi:hypothetical protein
MDCMEKIHCTRKLVWDFLRDEGAEDRLTVLEQISQEIFLHGFGKNKYISVTNFLFLTKKIRICM